MNIKQTPLSHKILNNQAGQRETVELLFLANGQWENCLGYNSHNFLNTRVAWLENILQGHKNKYSKNYLGSWAMETFFTHFQASSQKTLLTKCFSFLPRLHGA